MDEEDHSTTRIVALELFKISLSSDQYVDQFGYSAIQFVHIKIYNKLTIQTRKELKDQIHLQFSLHIKPEFFKLLKVLDYYHTVLMD